MKLGQTYPADEFSGPTIDEQGALIAVPTEPLTIDITGGREMTWWEANRIWALPASFVLLYMLANR